MKLNYTPPKTFEIILVLQNARLMKIVGFLIMVVLHDFDKTGILVLKV